MDQNTRLILISLTSIVSFIVFWIFFVFSIVHRFCWTYTELWFEAEAPITPFLTFIILFSLIATWLIMEFWITLKKKSFSFFNLSVFAVCFLFLATIATVLINFNITYKVEINKASPHDLLFKSKHFTDYLEYQERYPEPDVLPVINDNSAPPYKSWYDFIYEQTCDAGIDITGLSKSDYEQLRKKYEALYDH